MSSCRSARRRHRPTRRRSRSRRPRPASTRCASSNYAAAVTFDGQGHVHGRRGQHDGERRRPVGRLRRLLRLLRHHHPGHAVRQRHRDQRRRRQARQDELRRRLAHRQGRRPADALHHVDPDGSAEPADRLRDARRLRPPLGVPGAVGEDISKVGTGHVFNSDDAGETFTDISGEPARRAGQLVAVHKGHLVVGDRPRRVRVL